MDNIKQRQGKKKRHGGENEKCRFANDRYKKASVSAGFFVEYGAPCRIRTCDHILRRYVLYPTELRAHNG